MRRVVMWAILGFLAVAALGIVAGVPLLRFVGGFLIVRDPPQPADAIVVLAGSIPDRILEAVDLYQAHLAPRLILTREPPPPGLAAVRARGVALMEHHEQNRSIAEQLGVPPEAMTVLPSATASTFAEAQGVIAFLRTERLTSILLVTSKAHARRARLIFTHLADDGLRISVCPSRYDPFSADTWWEQRAFVRRVVIEYGKLLTYWVVDRWRPRTAL